jgi:Lar family restriction alleviation protein
MALANCPFCGGADLHVEGDSEPTATVQVLCDNPDCEAEGPHGDTPEDAVGKWNERRG